MDSDSNDHDFRVPDLTADDVWADPQCLLDAGSGLLPPKRAKAHHGRASGLDFHDGGLRLGSGPHGLEVAVISAEVVRLDPEIPAVERMPRQFTFHHKPAEDETRRDAGETREWGRSPKTSRQTILWYAGSGILVCSVVVAAMMLLPRINRSNAMEPRPGQTELVVAEDTTEAARPITEMLARQDEAERIYQTWLTASSPDEAAHLLRNPEIVRPKIADAAMPRLAPDKAVPARGATWIALDKGGLLYGMLEGMVPEHTALSAYFVIVDGALRMDWEATTGHGSADFASLARREGDASGIRGWIKPSDFYTLAFPEERYRSYQLLSPDQSASLWVYAAKDDPVHDTLSARFEGGAILSGTPQAEKFTLRLEVGGQDSLPNQWRIVELLHNDWIAP